MSGSNAAKVAGDDPLKKLAELADRVPKLPELSDLTEKLDEGLARATNRIAQALPSFPAGTLGALALGFPHAHPAHPPFIPLPPLGPVLFGASANVLIGGMPALRSGAIGLSPTCCGTTPFFVVLTGSSKVFIGGERAVRMSDLTMHCQPPPRPESPAAPVSSVAAPVCQKAGKALPIGRALVKGAAAVSATAGTVGEAASTADALLTTADTSGDSAGGVIVTSLVNNAAGQLAQKLQDEVAAAMAQAMGKDPAAPSSGTPGMVLFGIPNVVIGGLPTPGASVRAGGFSRLLPGKLRRRLTGYAKLLSGAG
jgi:uncharacterized Zn-binding protein involved in type VI secretion